MQGMKAAAIAMKGIALGLLLGTAWQATAQDAKTPYPNMAPVDQYLMEDREAEIALARSAAPESISRDAEVMVLGRHGYETVIQEKNGFVCIVERSWTSPIDDPGLLESEGACSDLLQCGGRTLLPSTHDQEDGFDTGWAHES